MILKTLDSKMDGTVGMEDIPEQHWSAVLHRQLRESFPTVEDGKGNWLIVSDGRRSSMQPEVLPCPASAMEIHAPSRPPRSR